MVRMKEIPGKTLIAPVAPVNYYLPSINQRLSSRSVGITPVRSTHADTPFAAAAPKLYQCSA